MPRVIYVGDIVQMKKEHPCGSSTWEITRVGADVKIRCSKCGRIVMLERSKFEKNLKKIIKQNPPDEKNQAES